MEVWDGTSGIFSFFKENLISQTSETNGRGRMLFAAFAQLPTGNIHIRSFAVKVYENFVNFHILTCLKQ